jgi:8-oxo-dGTP pyrophosphatase MutT (NUDIX family)
VTPIPTAGVLLFSEKKVLLVKHSEKAAHLTGWYGLPGGHIDEGETAEGAAVRELEEETGLIVSEDNLEELPIHIPPADIPRSDGTTKRFTLTLFYSKSFTGTLRESEETIPEWISIAEVDKLDLIGHTKKMIEEGWEMIKHE